MHGLGFMTTLGVALASAMGAHALSYDAKYTLAEGSYVAFTIDGTLQGDGNTILFTDVTNINAFNSVSLVSSVVPLGVAGAYSGGGPASVTLDGSAMNALICDDVSDFCLGAPFTIVFTPDGLFDWTFGGSDAFTAARWQIAPTPVPLPAAGALLLSAVGVIGVLRRRLAA